MWLQVFELVMRTPELILVSSSNKDIEDAYFDIADLRDASFPPPPPPPPPPLSPPPELPARHGQF